LDVHTSFKASKLNLNTGLDLRTNGSFKNADHLKDAFFNKSELKVNAHDGFTLKGLSLSTKEAIFWDHANNREDRVYFDNLVVQPQLRIPTLLKAFQNTDGLLDINIRSLQHNHFKNVFALGPLLHDTLYS